MIDSLLLLYYLIQLHLFQMIASHKATNKLAEQFVQYSSNITVQEIATKMIERQTKELKQMEKFVREIR